MVQWISAGLEWSRTWVQSYKKLDFFSVIGNRISNTSYDLQYLYKLYCQGGYVFGAKANLITCVAEFFLSVPIQYIWRHCVTSTGIIVGRHAFHFFKILLAGIHSEPSLNMTVKCGNLSFRLSHDWLGDVVSYGPCDITTTSLISPYTVVLGN